MAKGPKRTLEQVRASVRDALAKLTGDPGPEPGIDPAILKRKRPKIRKSDTASD